MKKLGLALFLLLFLTVFNTALYRAPKTLGPISGTPASVFFVDSVTEKSLKDIYKKAESRNKKNRNIRILIVPGHDEESPGTQFNGLRELDLNLELAQKLYELLKKENNIDTYISQTQAGYEPVLASYFENNREAIFKFIEDQKSQMTHYVSTGEIQRSVGVIHNVARTDTALKLYGINKWANENNIDIVIHIHFNDYPGRRKASPGRYSGFTIYVPDEQFSNAKGSRPVAEAVYNRLKKFYAQSNLPIEDGGVVEDQDLIALGSNNTLDGAGMLIEYSYIYETPLTEPTTRSLVLDDLALQTYLGVMDFFGEDTREGGFYDTTHLPFQWESDLVGGEEASPAVMSLQTALMLEGVYPPVGKTKNDCGISGYFGPCTRESVAAFQEKYGIEPASGYVGELTRAKLNELY